MQDGDSKLKQARVAAWRDQVEDKYGTVVEYEVFELSPNQLLILEYSDPDCSKVCRRQVLTYPQGSIACENLRDIPELEVAKTASMQAATELAVARQALDNWTVDKSLGSLEQSATSLLAASEKLTQATIDLHVAREVETCRLRQRVAAMTAEIKQQELQAAELKAELKAEIEKNTIELDPPSRDAAMTFAPPEMGISFP